MSSFVYSGGLLGNVISLLATAYIAHRTNWEASFYIMGGVCIPWMVLWPLLINDNPRTHKLIRQDELNYLIAALQLAEKKQRLKVPWKSIFLSGQIWTLIITHTSIGWGFYFMLTQLPLYMKMVLQFNLNENGIATSLPFIGMFLFSVFYGRAADYVISKEVLSLTLIRKFSNILATGVAALCCSIVPFTTNKYAVVALMVIATTVLGALYSGLMQSYMDLARNFAGTLIAITNTVATLAGIAVPLFVGWILNQDPSVASWRIVFLVTTGFYLLATIVYGLFITTTELPWNKPIEAPNRDEEGK
ncbi:Major Facilitator Superfamily [Popillia japonica]